MKTAKTLFIVVTAVLTLNMGLSYGKPLNVLFLTVDDMSCDSIGAFGCKVPETTPNLDNLAAEGLRFTRAHVQVGNCMPSRNVMQSGLYPHNNGVEGFYQVKERTHKILPELLKENGYFVGIKGKVSHTTPTVYEWDVVLEPDDRKDQRIERKIEKVSGEGSKEITCFFIDR